MKPKSYNREIAAFILLYTCTNGIASWWFDNALEVFKVAWPVGIPVVVAAFAFKAHLQSKETE